MPAKKQDTSLRARIEKHFDDNPDALLTVMDIRRMFGRGRNSVAAQVSELRKSGYLTVTGGPGKRGALTFARAYNDRGAALAAVWR
mgnify:CR=1 FL=1